MEIINTPDPFNNNSFAIRKFMKTDDDKYYAVVQPFETFYKIKINQSDYHKGLKAYHLSKSINCYPIEGVLTGNAFENVIYRLELKDKIESYSH